MIDTKEITSIKPQWFLGIISLLISCMCGLAFLALINYINVDKYFVYYGSSGPYSVTVDPKFNSNKENLHLSTATAVFHPGDWVGYNTSILVDVNIIVTASIALVNSDNTIITIDEIIVDSNTTTKRTEIERSRFFHLPDDLPPGKYSLKRRAIFKPRYGIPAAQIFPSIDFEVTA